MITQKLVNATVLEAVKLKENLTPAETRNLTLKALDSTTFGQCIYGLATGDCRSERAMALLVRCAPFAIASAGKSLSSITTLERADKKTFKERDGLRQPRSWSPIEVYIIQGSQVIGDAGPDPLPNNKALVRFLKGRSTQEELAAALTKTVNA